jgi:hypothetical protein
LQILRAENSKVIVILAGVIAALAIGVIAVNAAMKVYQATLVIITAAQALFNFVMSANPIGLVIIAIAAIVAALVILEKKFGVVTAALRIVGDGFKNGIIDPVRAAIGLIADLVRAIGKIPGVGAIGGLIGKIDIPGFADGGIVTRPTLAMVGEKGPEAIIPLSQMGGMGGGVTVNVTGGLSTSAEIGQAVVNAIRAYNRSAGPAQIQVA